MIARVGGARMPAWRRYLRFWRPSPLDDMRDELDFHLESSIEELVAGGMTRDAARDLARLRFGDVDDIRRTLTILTQQRERQMARIEWADAIRQDIIYGLRQLRKAPVFTAIAISTLALGIGATSAIFSVVYSVLLQPLPYAHSDRLVTPAQRNGGDRNGFVPFGNFLTWRAQASAFEEMGATWESSPLTLTGQGDPTPVATTRATSGYWRAAFIRPAAGRYFTDAEDRAGAPRVTILSYALWKARFGGDSGVVGRTIVLNAQPTTVVGVAAPEYILEPPAERVWVPLAPQPERLTDFSDHELTVVALLKPGVSAEAAARQLTEIDTRLAAEHPHSGFDGTVTATPLADSVVGPHRIVLYMLLGAVSLVLLIACGNIANLLLARATVRRGEIAIRAALGATRRRLVVQLLVESLMLGAGGALVGLLVAAVGIRFLLTGPAGIPRLQNATLNAPVVVFTLVVALLSAAGFGLLPALRAIRLDLQQTLRDGGRDSRTAVRERVRGVLVVSELCVAQVLLIGAALLIRSSIALQSVPPGFATKNLLATSILLPHARYPDQARIEAGFSQIEHAIAAVPGVTAVGRTQVAPIYGNGWSWTAMREGSDGHDAGAAGSDMRSAGPGYLSMLGVRFLRGRDFSASDVADGPRVAIVSRGLAKRLFGNADPIGKRISNGSVEKPNWREIVGVVDDMHGDGLAAEPPLELYMPSSQFTQPSQTLLIRGARPFATLLPEIRRAVATVDPLVALSNTSTMDEAIDRQLALSRFTTWLLTLLGATGLVLAVVGVYGVTAYFVTQRTHEFGVRLALGGSSGALRWLVVRQGIALALIGGVVGAALASAATRVLGTMMYGVTPHDPVTFAAITTLLAVVTIAASYIPARRATRIDPLEALRST